MKKLSTLYKRAAQNRTLRTFALLFGIPAGIYFVLFFVFQPHYVGHFTDAFYLDNGDGFQNVWNIWWVNHAIGAGQNPYFTTMLHWPHGTTLVPQTMNIINGLIGIPLMRVFGFNLFATVNFAVVLAFAMGGVTMFWFIRKLVKTYWVAIVAGALFTFSSYHMAHGIGHLQLVTLEWIPLFLLAYWTLLEKMRYRDAVFASFSLLLVLGSDYYYLFWSVILGAMWFGWKLYKREIKLDQHTLKVLGLFVGLSLALVGPLVYALLHLSKVDHLLGAHDPSLFGMDPLTVIMPGGTWMWGKLTEWYWINLPYMAEESIFFGFGLLIVLAIAFYRSFIKRKQFKMPSWITFWWIVFFSFGIVALGPHPRLFGHTLHAVPLPYDLLEKIFPTLEISGMPIRWILISLIAAIVIVSYMLSKLDVSKRRGMQLALLFIALSFIDLFPIHLPLTNIPTAKYVLALKALPNGAVLDNAAVSEPQQLRNQTIHEKPMVFGYVTRLPQSVADKDFQVFAHVEEKKYNLLCSQDRLRYITMPANRPLQTTFPIVYKDSEAIIYDFRTGPQCQ